jgi:YHS domain-containing protein
MPREPDASPPPPRRRPLRLVVAALAASAALFGGSCTPIPERDPASGCANCPVCLHDGDLGCVCVKVEKDTPHVEWNGKIWYFCSEECKQAFLSHPKRFNSSGGTR